jgi:hypothetical protein
MDDGNYQVTVTASGQTLGGMVIFEDGQFSGGGGGYMLRGHLADDDHRGVVEILKVDDDAPPRLGLFRHITVRGPVTHHGPTFRFEGRINGHHVIEVCVEGKRAP